MRYIKGKEEQEAISHMNKAAEIALKATCRRAKCGTVIVNGNEIICLGFNSPPGEIKSQRRCGCSKDSYHKKVTDKTCCTHAEQRAIFDALKRNSSKINGSKLYFIRIDEKGNKTFAGKPYCTMCSKSALDAGVKEFILWHDNGICSYDTEEYNKKSFEYKE